MYEIYDIHSWSDDEYMTISAIERESCRIREIQTPSAELKKARDIFVYLNKEILPLLEKSNEPLTILCFGNSRNEFAFLMDYSNYSTPFSCSNSTLIALKKLYEDTLCKPFDACIIKLPVQEPGHGVKMYLSITFGK